LLLDKSCLAIVFFSGKIVFIYRQIIKETPVPSQDI